MSLETWEAKYPTHLLTDIDNLTLRETLGLRKELEPGSYVWSARLSSGIFGRHDCPAGNSAHAPKGENEIMLGLGDAGLEKIIELGFVPCPTCHPEDTPDFWEKASRAISHKYPELSDPKEVLDRKLVPFDAGRVNWEELAPYLKTLPNRLYVPPNLDNERLSSLKARFDLLGFKLPPVGYYDHDSPTRFSEYKIQ